MQREQRREEATPATRESEIQTTDRPGVRKSDWLVLGGDPDLAECPRCGADVGFMETDRARWWRMEDEGGRLPARDVVSRPSG